MDVNSKASIVIAAADAALAQSWQDMLGSQYHVRTTTVAADIERMAQTAPRPDVVVLDSALANGGAFEACSELKAGFLTADLPVLMLAERAQIERAFEAGAADVMLKPIEAPMLRARVGAYAALMRSRALLKNQDGAIEFSVSERVREMTRMQDATVIAMAALAETKEANTLNHLRRIQHYVVALGRALRFHARFSAELTDENISLIAKAAPLHDIGKVGVPDAILLKPDKLTPEEFNVMKQHTVYGRDAIDGMQELLGASTPFLRYAREITYSHQERWDGSGYPQGLKGDDIPVSARLMAVADVYDALVSRRIYRPAFTHETAVELIRQGRGEHFDPDVVDAMLAVEDKFVDIANQLRDPL